MSVIKYIICCLCLLCTSLIYTQYSWDVRDPVDLNFIDFGDNKLLLYNGIGLGLTLLLDKSDVKSDFDLPKSSIGIQYYKEYYRRPLSKLTILNFRRRYRIRDYLRLGMDLRALYVSDLDVETGGLGGSIVFEWLIIRTNHFRFIYDNGVGPNLFFQDFPRGGTRFNFSTHYGLRVEFLIDQHWYYLGLNNLHISNADIRGRERNPALDAIGVVVGLIF